MYSSMTNSLYVVTNTAVKLFKGTVSGSTTLDEHYSSVGLILFEKIICLEANNSDDQIITFVVFSRQTKIIFSN